MSAAIDRADLHTVLILPVSGHSDSRERKYTTPSPHNSTSPSSRSLKTCSRSKSTCPSIRRRRSLHIPTRQRTVHLHRRQNTELRVSRHRQHHQRQRQLNHEAHLRRNLRPKPQPGRRQAEDHPADQANPVQHPQRPTHHQPSIMRTAADYETPPAPPQTQRSKPAHPQHHRQQTQSSQRNLYSRPQSRFPSEGPSPRASARRNTTSSAAFCSANSASLNRPCNRSVSSANNSSFSAPSNPLPPTAAGAATTPAAAGTTASPPFNITPAPPASATQAHR